MCNCIECVGDQPEPTEQELADEMAAKGPEHGQRGPQCECGGYPTWCAQCRAWSRTCCVEYGTCQCS